jgi:hypothetical protein
MIQKTQCIYKIQIKDIEKMIRMHYELDINLEGMDAVYNLLKTSRFFTRRNNKT